MKEAALPTLPRAKRHGVSRGRGFQNETAECAVLFEKSVFFRKKGEKYALKSIDGFPGMW